MKIKVGVIFGGESVEHEVSIISAVQAMDKIDSNKYEIIPIYISKDREWYTGEMLRDIDTFQDMSLLKRYAKNVVLYFKNGEFVLQNKKGLKKIVNTIDIAFPIVHGTNVEDGTLQGYLQSIGIPYVGSNVYASAVGQDKVYMKQIFESEKLPIKKYTWFYDNDYKMDSEEVLKKINKLKYPLIVKPAMLGSSVGINKAKDEEELIKAIEDAINYDSKIVVEEMVEDLTEVNISVLGDYKNQELSEIEEVIPTKDILTYEDKYIGDGKIKGKLGIKNPSKGSKGMLSANRKLPATIKDNLKKEVKETAIKAFKSLGSSGVCRIDFLVDNKENKVYINEINSIPGSLACYLWESIGKDYTDLLDEMINLGVKAYRKRTSKTHSFETNILKGYTGLKGAKALKGIKR
ncbi:MAG: D-alanine--D-alanine ligase family protein [Bacilli bacterium]